MGSPATESFAFLSAIPFASAARRMAASFWRRFFLSCSFTRVSMIVSCSARSDRPPFLQTKLLGVSKGKRDLRKAIFYTMAHVDM